MDEMFQHGTPAVFWLVVTGCVANVTHGECNAWECEMWGIFVLVRIPLPISFVNGNME